MSAALPVARDYRHSTEETAEIASRFTILRTEVGSDVHGRTVAVRATDRYQIGEDNGPECDGECEMSGRHAMAAAGVYLITEHRLRRRAAELRGGDTR